MDNNQQGKSFRAYGMYMLALLIFGTNGVLVSQISLESGQIVLLRTLIGGAVLTCLVFASGGFDKQSVRKGRLRDRARDLSRGRGGDGRPAPGV